MPDPYGVAVDAVIGRLAESRIYRSQRFEPIGSFLDYVMLLGSSGPFIKSAGQGPFYQIEYIEPVRGLGGGHGLTLLWTFAGAAPAGYTLPGGTVPSGAIAAGGNVVSIPNTFQMPVNELLQFRWTLHQVGASLGAPPIIDDIDVQIQLPRAISRGTVLNDQSRANVIGQVAELNDVGPIYPAQGANMAATVQTALAPWEIMNLSELFVFEVDIPSWTIINTGSAAASAGSLGVAIWGFRYVLRPLSPKNDWIEREIYGTTMLTPSSFQVIPIHGHGR